MVDKPDHKHTRTIFIHPHTGDKQAKQVLQTILTYKCWTSDVQVQQVSQWTTSCKQNFQDALMRRCTVSPTHVPCDLNLYINIRNEWDLLTVQPQPKSKPRHGLIRRKGKSQQAILICWKPADGSKITPYHDSSWDFRYPKSSTWCTSNYYQASVGSWLLIDLRKNTCVSVSSLA